jgi:RNA polymerase sigma-70 factor (ECF subfamily)
MIARPQPRPASTTALDDALLAERARLVRLCVRLTGDWDAAEDLTQETLVEALRTLAKLHDPAGLAPWLSAIARNVCKRWQRQRCRDLAHLALLAPARPTAAPDADGIGASTDAGPSDGLDELPTAGSDELTLMLERAELAALLDRALALLPSETRAALIGSYVQELPQGELAARLGLSESALRVRLHRGKLALRRALAGDLRDDAVELGLKVSEVPTWQETRIWCPFCGAHHLAVRMDQATGAYAFRCAGRCQDGIHLIGQGRDPALLGELVSPKSILTRHCLGTGAYYRQTLAGDPGCCPRCGARLRARLWDVDNAPHPVLAMGLCIACPACPDTEDGGAPWHLGIDTEAVQRFWRRHPRIRALPAQAIELAGRPAVLTSFESLEVQARLDVIAARDTYEVLRVAGEKPR